MEGHWQVACTGEKKRNFKQKREIIVIKRP